MYKSFCHISLALKISEKNNDYKIERCDIYIVFISYAVLFSLKEWIIAFCLG